MQKHAQYLHKNISIKLCSPGRFSVRIWDGEAVAYNRESGDLHYLDANCYRPFNSLQSIINTDEVLSCSVAQLAENLPGNEQDLLRAIAHLEKIGLVELLS